MQSAPTEKYNKAFKLFTSLEYLLADLLQMRNICRKLWIYTRSTLILSVSVSMLIASVLQIKQGCLSTVEVCNSNWFILGTSFKVFITQLLGSTTFSTITLDPMIRHLYRSYFRYFWLPSFMTILGTSFRIVIAQLLGSNTFSIITLDMMSRHLYGINFRYLWLTLFTLLSITNFLSRTFFFRGHFSYLWLFSCL